MKDWHTWALSVVIGFAVSFVVVARHRAELWRPVFERIAKGAGVGPVRSVRVLPGKGCGWSFGETIWVKTDFAGEPGVVELCMSRGGRKWMSITTTTAHELRTSAAK